MAKRLQATYSILRLLMRFFYLFISLLISTFLISCAEKQPTSLTKQSALFEFFNNDLMASGNARNTSFQPVPRLEFNIRTKLRGTIVNNELILQEESERSQAGSLATPSLQKRILTIRAEKNNKYLLKTSEKPNEWIARGEVNGNILTWKYFGNSEIVDEMEFINITNMKRTIKYRENNTNIQVEIIYVKAKKP